MGYVECELFLVYIQAIPFYICCHMEMSFDLRAELKGIQEIRALSHVYHGLTIPICMFNAESHFNSSGLQLTIFIHGLFL